MNKNAYPGRDSIGPAKKRHLQEAADLLLGDGGVILQREAVRPQGLDHLLDARARLHRHLLLGDVNVDHLVTQRHPQHRLVAQAEAVWT
eukprot:960724-Pleurochrysis_carterae.AAC.4